MALEGLNQLESDFIEFMAQCQSRPLEEMARIYNRTKVRFELGSPEFVKLMEDTQYLHRLTLDNFDDASSIRSYRAWELMSVLRQISYSLPRPRPSKASILKKALLGGQFKLITTGLKKRLLGIQPPGQANDAAMAGFLLDQGPEEPVVLDYGCGLAYVSFEMGRLNPKARFILVDVACLGLAFSAWRFAKHGLTVETVTISEETPYPTLPEHDICIATDVMEHVWQPETAYANIKAALKPGGILYGQFVDFEQGFWHISPDLQPIRDRLAADFTPLDRDCFKKNEGKL